MGVKLQYLSDNRGVVLTASDNLTGEEIIQAVRQVNAFAVNTKPICYTFADCDHLSGISVTTGDLADAARCAIEAATRVPGTERLVVMFAGDDYTYHLALLYKVFIERTGWQVQAFRDRAEALAWLRSRAANKHGIEVEVA